MWLCLGGTPEILLFPGMHQEQKVSCPSVWWLCLPWCDLERMELSRSTWSGSRVPHGCGVLVLGFVLALLWSLTPLGELRDLLGALTQARL